MIAPWLVVIVAATGAVAAIAATLLSPLSARLVDVANERSLHQRPTPRVGGIGVMTGALPFLFSSSAPGLSSLAWAALALAVISLRDDWRALPAAPRLAAHLACACVAVVVSADPWSAMSPASALAQLLAIIGIAWMTNAFNFMDGADGLAGGMSAIGFGTLGWAALTVGAAPLALACLALSGASLGFLAFNFPPARVFLGDAGSVPLGFLAGGVGWLGAQQAVWPLWFPILVFSPFIVDASLTLLCRAARREKILEAHRSHLYQTLILGGWSHRKLAFWSWALMLFVAGSALHAIRYDAWGSTGIILLWVACYVVVATAIRRRSPRGKRRPQGV